MCYLYSFEPYFCHRVPIFLYNKYNNFMALNQKYVHLNNHSYVLMEIYSHCRRIYPGDDKRCILNGSKTFNFFILLMRLRLTEYLV